jgi:hypothetical protein
MDDKRTDNVELRDKVISALLESKSTPLTTNYEVIQKLTHNFATFIETTGIAIPNLSMLLTQLKGDDPGAKLVFIQTQLAPRISNINAIIANQGQWRRNRTRQN